jgi:ribosomal protein S27E
LLTSYTEISCPNCKQKVALFHNNTQTYGCFSCGCVSSVKDGKASILNKTIKNQNYSPKSFIRLGQWMKYQSNDYLVIGRTVWSSDYKEYYSEDGETGYSKEVWSYHEWILTDKKGEVKYLFEDDEGYHFAESIKPKYPNLPITNTTSGSWVTANVEKNEIKNFKLNSNEIVKEIGNSTLQFIEGEIPWETNISEKIFFATYDDSGERYTVETEIGENDPKKASYFHEWGVTKKYLMQCFGQNKEIASQLEQAEEVNKKYNFWTTVFFIFASISFLTYFIKSGDNGTLVKEGTYVIPPAVDTTKTEIMPDFAGKISSVKLKEGPVKIILRTELPKNSDLWAGVEIHDENDMPINAIDDQFYDEEGTEYWQEDGESGYEYFHETNIEKSEMYHVEKAGVYSFEVFVAPQSMTNTTVYIAIYQDVMDGFFFIILGFFGLLMTVIFILIGYNSMPWRK